MRGRGRWDAARAMALLLIVFSVASWGLELALKLVFVPFGPVDMMDRPPPVVIRHGTSDKWEVHNMDILGSVRGFLGNFRGTLEAGNATTRYRVGSDNYEGSILAAWWSTEHSEAHSALVYDVYDNGTAVLNSLDCNNTKDGDIYIGAETERWGTIEECGTGPATLASTGGVSAPTIVLESDTDGEIHLVVEEESNYPGFMYSVWALEGGSTSAVSSDITITHSFYVASKSRMVEAIVTGIVNGVKTGGGCVDLLFQHSQRNTEYVLLDGKTRASPFGEHPGHNSSVEALSDVEPIELGVYMDKFASACLIIVSIVSVVGVACSVCVSSRIGLDVYDRDELIKVLSLLPRGQGQIATKGGNNNPPPPAMRIFVGRNASKELEITVSHAAERSSGCCRGSPSAVIDECGQSNTVHHTGGENRIRLEGVPVEASLTNDFPKLSPLSSSQGPATSRLKSTVANRARLRHVHAPSSETRTAVQSQMPRAPKPVSRNDHVPASKQYTRGRSHARKKSQSQQAPTTQAVQGLAEVSYAAYYTGDATPRPVSPTTSSRVRASSSENKETSQLSAPEALLLQRHNVLSDAQHLARRNAARPRAPRDKVAARATFRTPMKKRRKKSTNRKRAAATLDGEAALGATFGRPPTVTE